MDKRCKYHPVHITECRLQGLEILRSRGVFADDIELCPLLVRNIHLRADVADSLHQLHVLVHESDVIREVQFVRSDRPCGGHDCLRLWIKRAVDLFCDKWHEGMKQLHRLTEHIFQCPQGCVL